MTGLSKNLEAQYSKSVPSDIDSLEKEAIFYVREYFDLLRTKWPSYKETLTKDLIRVDDYRKLLDLITEDRKLIEELEEDQKRETNSFVMKADLQKIIVNLDKTQAKFDRLVSSQSLPRVTVHRPDNLQVFIHDMFRDTVFFKNNINELVLSPDQRFNFEEKSKPQLSSFLLTSLEGPINYLHFFQDNSNLFHSIRVENNPMYEWEKTELDIPFKIPLFHSSVTVRKDCVLLAGGVDTLKGISQSNVYLLTLASPSLIKVGELLTERNCFSMATLQDKVFAIGGSNERQGKLASCESVKNRCNC